LADSVPCIQYCFGLLKHCSGVGNYFFGGAAGARLDFIAFHKKVNGSADGIVSGQEEAMKEIVDRFPSLRSKPFFNDEADPEKSWWKTRPWQGDVGYPAMLAEAIIRQGRVIFIMLCQITRLLTVYYLCSLLSDITFHVH
jgi:hypothetical protein